MYDRERYLKQIEDVIAKGPYTDTWDSLSRHRVPEWFCDGKFGIFIHWGPYSVPAFGSEWYSRNMYIQGSREYEHHLKTYGAHKDFGYKDFIPMFRAEKFNAEEWIDLFSRAGAQYVVPVAEHHDGFQMYKSELSRWNSYEMGPKRDVLGELTEEMGKKGLVNGASTHRIEHWFFMGHGKEFESDITDKLTAEDLYWPAMPERDHHDIYSGPAPTKEFLDDWMIRTCELIDRYHIKQLYFDWWIEHDSAKPYLKKIAAYYYNRAAEWGEEVMIAYKHDAFMFGTAVVDLERGQFAKAQPFHWQTDTAIARNSWCYTENNEFKEAGDIIRSLADIVSKNGCLLLNVGPKADGSISEEDRKVLLEIGDWLKVNGEAIYGTRVWKIAEEGPTESKGGYFSDNDAVPYTAEDFRFTVKGSHIYVIAMNYPENGEIVVKSLKRRNSQGGVPFEETVNADIIDAEVLGFDEQPQLQRTQEGLHIRTQKVRSDKPVVFKITMK